MPLPWGRLFWTFMMGLLAGVIGYAIYRGDLRWELPKSTSLRASPLVAPAPGSAPAPASSELPAAAEAPPATATAKPAPASAPAEARAEVPVEAGVPPTPTSVEPARAEPAPSPAATGGAAQADPPAPLDASIAEVFEPAAPTPAPAAEPAPSEQTPPSSPPPEQEEKPAENTLIVPGISVGDIVRNTSARQLAEKFGKKNVSAAQVSLGGGFSEPGTALFPKDAERELQILWSDAKNNRKPRVIHVRGRSWRTAEGIGLGTSLRELEDLNGGPFTLSGFGWDYAGAVVSWGNGKLATLLQKKGRVQLWLRPPDNKAPASLIGDADFQSSNPAMRTLDPKVYAMTVELP